MDKIDFNKYQFDIKDTKVMNEIIINLKTGLFCFNDYYRALAGFGVEIEATKQKNLENHFFCYLPR